MCQPKKSWRELGLKLNAGKTVCFYSWNSGCKINGGLGKHDTKMNKFNIRGQKTPLHNLDLLKLIKYVDFGITFTVGLLMLRQIFFMHGVQC